MNEKILSEVITGCKDNNRKSQYELYKYLAPKLLASCMKYVQSKAEAEEIIQDTFIKIFKNIDSFRSDSSIYTWSFKIMLNTTFNKLKLLEKYSGNVEIDVAKNVHSKENLNSHHDNDEILNLLLSLPELLRTIFNLYEIEGYSHKEIGEMLGIGESSSRVYLHRAKLILQEEHRKINIMYHEKQIS